MKTTRRRSKNRVERRRLVCLYEHWRPDRRVCFYVGIGSLNRASGLRRNKHHRNVVSKLHKQGLSVCVKIVSWFDTPKDAGIAEIEHIAYYRRLRHPLTNYSQGGEYAEHGPITRNKMREIHLQPETLTKTSVGRAKGVATLRAQGFPNLQKAWKRNKDEGYARGMRGVETQRAQGFLGLVKGRKTNLERGHPGLVKGRETQRKAGWVNLVTGLPKIVAAKIDKAVDRYGEHSRIILLVDHNPKRVGSRAYRKFALYQEGLTLNELYDVYVRNNLSAYDMNRSIAYDTKHGYIRLNQKEKGPEQ